MDNGGAIHIRVINIRSKVHKIKENEEVLCLYAVK